MLKEILAKKKAEVALSKKRLPLAGLRKRIEQRPAPLDFALALSGNGQSPRLIAEVKRASPSRGMLCPDFDPVALAKTYAEAGAAAISVLTEVDYFKGSLDYLEAIRKAINLPLLRKDFIFDPYQVYESRANGADALLLIVAILDQARLKELLSLSHDLGMPCLVEVHNEKEIEMAISAGAGIIGINNRDLNTLVVDINTTARLRPLIPSDKLVVSESGIRTREDIEKMKGWGVNAVLVGEALVTARDITTRVKELIA